MVGAYRAKTGRSSTAVVNHSSFSTKLLLPAEHNSASGKVPRLWPRNEVSQANQPRDSDNCSNAVGQPTMDQDTLVRMRSAFHTNRPNDDASYMVVLKKILSTAQHIFMFSACHNQPCSRGGTRPKPPQQPVTLHVPQKNSAGFLPWCL